MSSASSQPEAPKFLSAGLPLSGEFIHNFRRGAEARAVPGDILPPIATAVEAEMVRRPAGLTALAILSLVSCSQRNAPPPSPSATVSQTRSPTSASPSADPQAAARQAIVAGYAALYADIAAATAAGNPQSPVLGRHASGAALTQLEATVRAYVDQGVVLRGSPKTRPTIAPLDLDTGTATVADCPSYASVTAVDRKTGQPVPGFFATTSNPTTVTFRRQGTSWLATFIQTDRSRTCAV